MEMHDHDPQETREWLDALGAVLEVEGPERAHYLLERLIEKARRSGAYLPHSANTAYINTIPPHREERSPGDYELEHRIRSYVRWNALAMVLRANRHSNVGGHIASFASAATLYDVGYNHFWRARTDTREGDLLFAQGHSAPGHLRARFPARAAHRGTARQFPPGGRRQGLVVLSASLADARFLALPDGVHGPRSAHGHLSGAVHEVSAGPRHRRHRRGARCGRSWATARWTSPSRWGRSASRRASVSTT